MREVVLDTETTGLDVLAGHRIVEIGCVELENRVPTGRVWQTYLNPRRANDPEALEVHRLSDEFLARQPLFRDRAAELLAFLDDSRIVMHNAEFDLAFLNREIEILNEELPMERRLEPIRGARVTDTLALAREKYPGQANSLKALTDRFEIDDRDREHRHAALLDARLLADVYLALAGGRQTDLALGGADPAASAVSAGSGPPREVREPRPHAPTAAEIARHEAFLDRHVRDPIWRRLPKAAT